ncbi:Leucine carboxyl methyltransferase domain-containing protein [Phytophthora infestans]|uniref:Leucine carboxyl methyltransferase domain-containing protein n=1 Tax=Phytophthora infestans TaxID=4787 RepID=A0A8S9UNP6_PHYIN|nr:Leucine carboxyl methyltransferase domain-containing protein [Phytophthora infestans]
MQATFAGFTGFGTAYLRAIESMRSDRITRLTFQNRADLEKALITTPKLRNSFGDFISIRTRYLDEALEHRDAKIRQVVILGAGLDTRAFRLETLRGCHILELIKNGEAFESKIKMTEKEDMTLIAERADYIVANLTDDDWDSKLLADGFAPSSPTFWTMEGLLPYLKCSNIIALLDALDGLSAPGSEFGADMPGHTTFSSGNTATMMKYAEKDPLHGVLSKIPWCLKMQASLGNEGIHFGREWSPLVSQDTNENISIAFIMGKKPVCAEVRLKDVCPGLDF